MVDAVVVRQQEKNKNRYTLKNFGGFYFIVISSSCMETQIIDRKIKKTVDRLNQLGISTTGSCEGHITYGSPAPWIKVTAKNELKNIKFRKILRIFLREFYKNRCVRSDVQIVTENANIGFWIHNGGKMYEKWRKEVKKRVNKIKQGEQAPEVLTKEEKIKRKKKLPIYQKEIKLFGKFLSKKTS